MNRLEQDAADELAAHEQQRAWRERQERHKQGYAQQPPSAIHSTWAPVHTEQQKQELAQYIKQHGCKF